MHSVTSWNVQVHKRIWETLEEGKTATEKLWERGCAAQEFSSKAVENGEKIPRVKRRGNSRTTPQRTLKTGFASVGLKVFVTERSCQMRK